MSPKHVTPNLSPQTCHPKPVTQTCHPCHPMWGGEKSFENPKIQESKNLKIPKIQGGSKVWKIQKSKKSKVQNSEYLRSQTLRSQTIHGPKFTVSKKFTVPNSRSQKSSRSQIHGLKKVHGHKFTVSKKFTVPDTTVLGESENVCRELNLGQICCDGLYHVVPSRWSRSASNRASDRATCGTIW
jgi:hypothetical protein